MLSTSSDLPPPIMDGLFTQIQSVYLKNILAMKQSCMTRQPAIVNLGNGKYQFIYNQQEVQRDEETFWEYDYVEVDKVDKATIIQAIIHKSYSLDDEVALINNYNQGLKIEEYEAYQQFRNDVKSIINELL